MRISVVVLALGVVGCSTLSKFRHPAAPAPPPAQTSRPLPYPVFETHAFAGAVARGTRTRVGEPGPNYWQQYARYTIDAELIPATSRINGRESVRYYNRSPDTLRTLWIELDQNLFAPSSPRVVTTPVTGGTEILRVAAAGQALASRDTGAGYSVYATNMELRLPRALATAGLGRPRHRVGVSASARRRASRGYDRRRLHGRVLVPSARRLRRRRRLAERPVPRRRRVLHGVRGLRRESHRAARLARRGDG